MDRRAFLAAASAVAVRPLGAAAPAPYGAIPSPRQLAWHELETNAFLHFTVNTFTGKEWGYGDEDPNIFAPARFDADAIVEPLAQAGMKGVILTAKHHDGFCLWPTATTAHSVASARGAAAKATWCARSPKPRRRHASGFGVYLSPWDRNNAALRHAGVHRHLPRPTRRTADRLRSHLRGLARRRQRRRWLIMAARARSGPSTRRLTTTGRAPGTWSASSNPTR